MLVGIAFVVGIILSRVIEHLIEPYIPRAIRSFWKWVKIQWPMLLIFTVFYLWLSGMFRDNQLG